MTCFYSSLLNASFYKSVKPPNTLAPPHSSLFYLNHLDSEVSTRKRSTEAIKSRDTPTKCCKAPDTRCAS